MAKVVILFASANPARTPFLNTSLEWKAIQEELQESKYRDRFDLRFAPAASEEALRKALFQQDPHLVHFTGHGTEDEELLFEEKGERQPVSAATLNEMFDFKFHHLRGVLLNACYSLSQGKAIAQHVACVIGVKEAIQNQDSVEFSRGFYRALFAGYPLQDAVLGGQQAMSRLKRGKRPLPTIVLLPAGQTGAGINLLEDGLPSSGTPPASSGVVGPTVSQPKPLETFLSHLPVTGKDLFGREAELRRLDDAWADPGTHILSLVAWGGVGKSALVNSWLGRLAREQHRGAEWVYGWSFYTQGTTDHQASTDQFFDAALRWFGDPDPTTAKTPGEKGLRLARFVRDRRTLLVLDGLEPLQNKPGPEGGRIKDPALQTLLRELAAHNPRNGLCLISTRVAVADLASYEPSTAPRLPLDHLTPEAGAELLEALGVDGDPAELARASVEFGGHCLALTLLGGFLRDACHRDVRRRREVKSLESDLSQGGHARRVMAAYEKWFGESSKEVAVLRLLGLFDRPADAAAVGALRAAPPIRGLTKPLFVRRRRTGWFAFLRPGAWEPLGETEWQQTLGLLRQATLLAEASGNGGTALDAHPLVRQHFAQRVQQVRLRAWRRGNDRLYEHLKRAAKEFPDTVAEMAPLYAAVAHGCQAGRHQEVLDEVYWQRISRKDEFFSTTKLSAYGDDLAALAGFFEKPWDRPVAGLTRADQAFVLGQAGFHLWTLGQLTEVARPQEEALKASASQQHWGNAARSALNLSDLYVTLGQLHKALEFAEQSVNLAAHIRPDWAPSARHKSYAQQCVDLEDRRDDRILPVVLRAGLADILHHLGRFGEAKQHFEAAEQMQRVRQPKFPFLYSLPGRWYCDLLLTQQKAEEVQRRAGQTLQWARQAEQDHLTIALDFLSLGQAFLQQAQRDDAGGNPQAVAHLKTTLDQLRQAGHENDLPEGGLAAAQALLPDKLKQAQTDLAAAHLELAVDRLRRAGHQDYLPEGLLARAQLHLFRGNPEQAEADLNEIRSIADRGGMRIHQAESHLGYARLALLRGEKPTACQELTAARDLIREVEYLQRDGELKELASRLGLKL